MKQSMAQMKVLVTGGAGYIGSHMVKYLIEKKCMVTVMDNLSTGHLNAVQKCNFIEGDLADQKLIEKVFLETQFDAVFHFAAFSQVGESVMYPLEYFRNNVS
ncbi:MAG: NAD-dependent epimerase/dehydratase family protein, partial [Limisphaerales bacterium]